MRYGVLADIHANLHALEVAVGVLRARRVDRFVCAGDIVGYGAHPNECVELVASLDAVCVAGNHDLIAIGEISGETAGTLARTTLEWTASALSPDARAFLASLPRRTDVAPDAVIAHGSLDDPLEYTRDGRRAARQLGQLARERPEAGVLVLGHTHRAAAWNAAGRRRRPRRDGSLAIAGDRFLLNPGGVGQSRDRDALARCMLLDLDRREATFYALAYDVGATVRALRREGLPEHTYHVPQTRVASNVRRAKRVARRVRRIATGERLGAGRRRR